MEVGALGSVNVEELIGKENTKPCGAERGGGGGCRSPASRQGFVVKPARGEPGWQRSLRSKAPLKVRSRRAASRRCWAGLGQEGQMERRQEPGQGRARTAGAKRGPGAA